MEKSGCWCLSETRGFLELTGVEENRARKARTLRTSAEDRQFLNNCGGECKMERGG
jgi:hypothetical protein